MGINYVIKNLWVISKSKLKLLNVLSSMREKPDGNVIIEIWQTNYLN